VIVIVVVVVTTMVVATMAVATMVVTAHFMRNDVQKDIAQQPTDCKCHSHF
jgi:hypothetical protein